MYLADDTKLGRKVALKILPPEAAANQDRLRRFVQEGKTLASLTHQNIAQIYESGKSGEMYFIAMEFVKGETLRQRLKRRRLKVVEALNIGWQISSALLAAHDIGIIHRDLKPENVMLCLDGQVKVLDFGIAKLVRFDTEAVNGEAPTWSKTDPNTLWGTVAYMSPEQIRRLTLDERTDTFTLGVVIYEMIAGRHPFLDGTSNDPSASILEKEPLPLAHFTTETLPELEWIVLKALSKEAEDRYQTAKDFFIDLKRLAHKLDMDAEIKRTGLPYTAADRAPNNSREALIDASPVSDQNQSENLHRTARLSTSKIVNWLAPELKFGRLQVMAILLFTILTGITVYYYINRELEKNREFYFEKQLEQDLDRTINQISLFSPSDLHKERVNEVKSSQANSSSGGVSSQKFDELLRLVDVLHTIIVENKATEKSVETVLDELGRSNDKFVASRALLLKTPKLFYPLGFCGRPDETLAVIGEVFKKDRNVAAASNVSGVCLAQKSHDLLKKIPGVPSEEKPQLWADSVKSIGDSLTSNQRAFDLNNRSTEANITFRNNKVWNSMQFLSGTVGLDPEDLRVALKTINVGDMETFFSESLKDMEAIVVLGTGSQPAFTETLAELHGLKYIYYTDDRYRNDQKAQEAKGKVFKILESAIVQGLLELRKLKTLEEAEKYFEEDSLLKLLFDGPLNHRTLNPKIKLLIEQRLARQ